MKLLLSHLFPDDYQCEGNKNTCLLIIRPVKVGSKKLSDQFRLYEPPEQYVSSQSHDIWNALLFAGSLNQSPQCWEILLEKYNVQSCSTIFPVYLSLQSLSTFIRRLALKKLDLQLEL